MKLNTKTILLLMPLVFSMASCGSNKTQGHTHSKETAYSYDENGHYHSCSCDENIRFDYTAHTYTTNSEGINSCSICGYVENQDKDKLWKVIKNSLEKTIKYDGAYTTVTTGEMNTTDGNMKASLITTTDPNSGKYLSSSITKMYDPTSSSWIDAEKDVKKVKIEEDKYIYYLLDGDGLSAQYTDKYYGQYAGGTNPLNSFMDGQFFGEDNKLFNVLQRVENYNELITKFPELYLLNSRIGDFNIDLEMKDNLYVFNFNIRQIQSNESSGILVEHESMTYSIFFDEEKFVKSEILMNTYGEDVSGDNESMIYKIHCDVKYGFDEELYNQETFETKPTPSGYTNGRANLIFNDGFVWDGAYRTNKINEKVTERASTLGLELYYDKDLKNKVSDDELLTTLPKSYYVKQSIDPKRAYVLLLSETNYKASSLYKKFIKEYTEKTVSDYVIYTSANTFNIYTFPSNSEIRKLNAKVTVNGVEVTNSNVSVSTGNVYTIIVSKDAVIRPFE